MAKPEKRRRWRKKRTGFGTGEGFLELLFALKTYFQAEILGHSVSPPRKKGIKNEPCGSGNIGKGAATVVAPCVLNCSARKKPLRLIGVLI